MMGCLKLLTPNTKSDKRWFISVRESRRTWFSFATFGCGKDATPQRQTYGRRWRLFRRGALVAIILTGAPFVVFGAVALGLHFLAGSKS